jgi:phosphoglycerate dehydrogenase-like enzyme
MSNTTTRRDLLAGLAATAAVARAEGKTPPHFRVAITGDYEDLALRAAPWGTLGDEVEVVSFNKPLTAPRDTIKALRDFDAVVLMRERTPMPREVLEHLPRLKLIVFSGLMNATLDHKAAAERNIVIARALGMSGSDDEAPAVNAGGGAGAGGAGAGAGGGSGGGGPAELALALMLACSWHIPQADALIRRGEWSMQPQIPLKIPLAGKVLGIPGYGGIGARAGRYGKSLGMKVLGFSRSLSEETARVDGITRAPDLETIMRNSDVISVHLPLTAQTRGMIGARELGWMKPGVIFINTARGPIVDQAALIEALKSRRIAMAGFDVYDEEPLPRRHPFTQLPNVIMTPHIGYVSESGMTSRYKALFEVVADFRKGVIKNRYTPSEKDVTS